MVDMSWHQDDGEDPPSTPRLADHPPRPLRLARSAVSQSLVFHYSRLPLQTLGHAWDARMPQDSSTGGSGGRLEVRVEGAARWLTPQAWSTPVALWRVSTTPR